MMHAGSRVEHHVAGSELHFVQTAGVAQRQNAAITVGWTIEKMVAERSVRIDVSPSGLIAPSMCGP
jgi:hypothetical protein